MSTHATGKVNFSTYTIHIKKQQHKQNSSYNLNMQKHVVESKNTLNTVSKGY